MTYNTLITNQYGSFGIKDVNKCNGWDLTSVEESLIPFVNELDAGRAILAYTHRSQASPIINGEVPLVATGAEFVIPQIASSKFILKAKSSGTIEEIKKNEFIKVKYKDGTTDYIDISPRMATTRRASFLNLQMNTLENGNKFKKDQIIAWTNNFNGEAYTSGRNITMAIMNYMGFSHEDGYVLSNEIAKTTEVECIDEITAIIPPGVKVTKLADKINTETKMDESLIEFTYANDLETYIDQFNILDPESEEELLAFYTEESNKIKVKSPGGEIQQIKIFINGKKDLDDKVLTLWKQICSDLRSKTKKYASQAKTQEDKLAVTDNLDMAQLRVSIHKYRGNEFEGARISYFIKRKKSLYTGDKLSNRFGAKGVVSHIIDKNNTPRGKYSGDIGIFISPISVLGRKNLASIKELYIGKIVYFLPQIVNDHFDANKNIDDVINLITNVYDLLDTTDDKRVVKSLKSKIDKLGKTKFENLLKNKTFKFNFIVEPFVNIPMSNIKSISKLLDLPLEEKVFIPELNCWTKTKVPVGITYINAMEQLADDYESLRSTAKYTSITGQPVKGRAQQGGQSIGNLDVYNILTYDTPSVLEELMTLRSDDFINKRKVTTEIIQTGKASMPRKTGNAITSNLYNIHITAMGLNVE